MTSACVLCLSSRMGPSFLTTLVWSLDTNAFLWTWFPDFPKRFLFLLFLVGDVVVEIYFLKNNVSSNVLKRYFTVFKLFKTYVNKNVCSYKS